MIPLSHLQKEIMQEFYNLPATKIIFNKQERNNLWSMTKRKNESIDLSYVKKICPALAHQIQKSYDNGNNIQSAVFSECVYAQTFANMLNLNKFINCFEVDDFLSQPIENLLKSYNLSPRYVYVNNDDSRLLIQAGGCNGIDSALICVENLDIYTIEFKEAGAKISEPDLPKYKEDGHLRITDEFLSRYPQFESMLNEQKDLNFFEVMGQNIHDFSPDSINIAVTNNYSKKYADVICTEDTDGYLVMLPANQIPQWAKIEGEIRPAGRNHYEVWTPNALRSFLLEKNAIIKDDIVTIELSELTLRKARGGNNIISGYKINPLFFVYAENCTITDQKISFNLHCVRQLNPTIAGKMFFGNLKHQQVKEYYFS